MQGPPYLLRDEFIIIATANSAVGRWKQILASSREQPRQRPRERPRSGQPPDSPGQRLRKLVLVEGLMIVMLAVALYLLLALASYSAVDPGWSRTGTGAAIQNSMGRSGAWFADVLYLLFGNLAWLLPVILVWRSVHMFRERKTLGDGFSWELLGLRSTGFLLLLISACVLASMHFASALQGSAGGLLGRSLAQATLPALELAGASLLYLTLLVLGLTLGLGISWLRVVDAVGLRCLLGWAVLQQRIQQWRDRQREEQETRQLINQRKENFDHYIEKEKKRKPIEIAPVREVPRQPSKRVQKEKQRPLFESAAEGDLPPLSILNDWDHNKSFGYSTEALEAMSRLLEIKLKDFGIEIEVVAINPARDHAFRIQPAAGVKVSRISNLVKDLARSLAVISVRVVEVIPGKSVVGIEIPNEDRETVIARRCAGLARLRCTRSRR
jgi:DNA segregation ATPase FtsK/SpoIIIE, S-DNA-T family